MADELAEHRVSKKAIVLNCTIMTILIFLFLNSDLIQLFLTWIVGLFVLLGLTFLRLCTVSWDLIRNPWVEDANFKWWNCFTTSHYATWLFVKDENLWLRLWIFYALPLSISAAAMLFNSRAGISSMLLSVFISSIILAIEKRKKMKPQSKKPINSESFCYDF